MSTYLDAAGPTGAPAVAIHPDTELPKAWRVFAEWEHDGQRGAWLVQDDDELAHVIYDPEQPVRQSRHVGSTLDGATSRLRCFNQWWERGNRDKVKARRTYYAERGVNTDVSDHAAWLRYLHAGQPGPETPYTCGPSDPPAPPITVDDVLQFLIDRVGIDDVRRAYLVKIHPDTDWPVTWQHVTIDGQEWAMGTELGCDWYHFIPVELIDHGKVYTALGLSNALRRRHSDMWSRAYELNGKTWTHRSAAPESIFPSLEAPPEPGVSRAKWIGNRITGLVAFTDPKRPAHTRRRVAARLALARIDGYCATDPDNDALYIADASLELAGLNEYARRVLDFGETPITGGTQDALL